MGIQYQPEWSVGDRASKPGSRTGRFLRTADSSLLLTEKESAALLGFSVRTLQAWRVRGGGPTFVKVSTRCVRYRRDDIERWIEERLRTSTSDPGVGDREDAE